MTDHLQALILRRGKVVRKWVARAETVVRYLAGVSSLAEYEVRYWWRGRSHLVSGEEFLRRVATNSLGEGARVVPFLPTETGG